MVDEKLQGLLDTAEELGQAVEAVGSVASSHEEIEDLRREFLAKKGKIQALLKSLGELPPELRPLAGARLNVLRDHVRDVLDRRERYLAEESQRETATPRLDVTMPGFRRFPGRVHPLSQTRSDLIEVFTGLGYSFQDYPEVESEYFNFDALNMPEWHPARDMHDTFYLKDGGLLRTHTSAFQVRIMRWLGSPPLREMTSGRCYRNDPLDASHSPVFHQFDGIGVSEEASLAELKWTLYQMARQLFGEHTQIRFRPSYFPFTTPSAEVDVTCAVCSGQGCRVCKHTGWVEILGCGMIHPHVLRSGGLDPGRYRGYAFGMGVDRIALLRWGIEDIRLFSENDLAFLDQF